MNKIRMACIEIAYDNGMINRYNTEVEVVEDMLQRVLNYFSMEAIDMVEQELLSMSEEQFMNVCVGSADEMVISELANSLLDVAFERMENE